MLGIDRRTARYVWTAALVVLLLYVVFLIRKTLFVFIIALLLAYLLSPLVDLIDRLLPTRRTRTLALAIAYVLFIGILVIAVSQVGSRVVEQANLLAKRFPDMLARLEQPPPDAGPPSLQRQAFERIRAEVMKHSSDLLAALPQAGFRVLAFAGNLIDVIVVPILAFFFLKDGRAMRQQLLELADEGPQRALLDDVMADVHLLLAHYMRALALLALGTFIAYVMFFSIIGVPYAILLSTVAFLLEFIPMIGPLTAGIAIMVVAGAAAFGADPALTGGQVLGVLVFMLAYRLFQDYFLQPHLMGVGVQLHPLLVIFGVFAGAEIAGIPGTFLSVPVLALVRIVYIRIRKARAAAHLTSPVPATRL
jgi:predicted PurR-regulated permease PerM